MKDASKLWKKAKEKLQGAQTQADYDEAVDLFSQAKQDFDVCRTLAEDAAAQEAAEKAVEDAAVREAARQAAEEAAAAERARTVRFFPYVLESGGGRRYVKANVACSGVRVDSRDIGDDGRFEVVVSAAGQDGTLQGRAVTFECGRKKAKIFISSFHLGGDVEIELK